MMKNAIKRQFKIQIIRLILITTNFLFFLQEFFHIHINKLNYQR